MKTEISTSAYEFAHGKKPSGWGSWAFEFRIKGVWVTWFAPGEKKYSEARKLAVAEADKIGNVTAIRVGS